MPPDTVSPQDTDNAQKTDGFGDQEESRLEVGVDTHCGLPSSVEKLSFPEDCLKTRRAIATPGTSLSSQLILRGISLYVQLSLAVNGGYFHTSLSNLSIVPSRSFCI